MLVEEARPAMVEGLRAPPDVAVSSFFEEACKTCRTLRRHWDMCAVHLLLPGGSASFSIHPAIMPIESLIAFPFTVCSACFIMYVPAFFGMSEHGTADARRRGALGVLFSC